MRINRHTSLLLAAAVALAVAAPAAADKTNDPQGAKDQTNSTQLFYDCEDGEYTTNPSEVDGQDHVEFFGDDVMWPPNHKTQDMEVIARASDADEPVAIYTESTHDEFVTTEDGEEELNGSGNTEDDAEDAAGSRDMAASGEGVARTTVTLRSERSGRGDGRTYEVDSYAFFGDGEDETACTDDGAAEHHPEGEVDDDQAVNFFVIVPHDMRSAQGEANGKNGGASLDDEGNPKGGGNS